MRGWLRLYALSVRLGLGYLLRHGYLREAVIRVVIPLEPSRYLELPWALGALGARPGERVLDLASPKLLALALTSSGVDVVSVDRFEREIETWRTLAGDAVRFEVADGRSLPFADAEFDIAVAAWVLFHVADVDRALAGLARVLCPGGRLVAVTNSTQHLRELTDLGGLGMLQAGSVFRNENGAELLERHFARVERRDAYGWLTLDDAAMRAYAGSTERLAPLLELPPLEEPLRVRREPTIFVAEKA
jgi:SAM-dependent methyltransferase